MQVSSVALADGSPSYTPENVLQAIQYMFSPSTPDAERRKADDWLKDFQKSMEAWTIADGIIRMDNVGSDAQIFAAQTLRQKIRYDLEQLDQPARMQLRDSLLNSLLRFRTGPRPVSTSLCMGIARLAILIPSWQSPIQQFIAMFQQPEDLNVLLTLLATIPEEFSRNRSMTLSTDEFNVRKNALITQNANEILHMIVMMLSSEIKPDLRYSVLDCLYSWTKSGDIPIASVGSEHVLSLIFAAFQFEETFEIAGDLLCQIIMRIGTEQDKKEQNTPEVCIPIIRNIRLGIDLHLAYLQRVAQAKSAGQDEGFDEDDDKLRVVANIFACAGENYIPMITDDLASWKSVVDGVLTCATIPEFEIIRLTFQFWSLLADDIRDRRPDVKPQFLDLYRCLIDVMMKHLHYPIEPKWSPEERDEFREFRHAMGDVLKVCVMVLGEQEALLRPYQVLTGFILAGAGPGAALDPSIPWQNIEAPLFALRTMGGKVSMNENKMLPEIMEMLPRLPSHPKVRYAAILVIGRYAAWTKQHPAFIPYQMTFISKGFEDKESVAAACQALKFLCEECGEMLVDYLGQLHPFYVNVINVIEAEERLDLVKALANVIKHVPVVTSAENINLLKLLETFCLPIAQRLHEIASNITPNHVLDKAIVNETSAFLKQLGTFIYVCQPKEMPEGVVNPCVSLFQSVWPVLQGLVKLGVDKITYSVSAVIVDIIELHTHQYGPLENEVLTQIVESYVAGGDSCLMWTASRFIKKFGKDEGAEGNIMIQVVEAMSGPAFKAVQEAPSVNSVAPVIEDYFALLSAIIYACPVRFIQSNLLSSFVQCAIACMPVREIQAWSVLYIDFIKRMLMLATPFREQRIPDTIAAPLTETIKAQCAVFVTTFFRCLVDTFPHPDDVRDERVEKLNGWVIVLLWDVIVASTVDDNAGEMATGPRNPKGASAELVGSAATSMAATELMKLFAAGISEIAQNVPIFATDAEGEAFVQSIASYANKRDVGKIDRMLGDFVTKYMRSNARRNKHK